MAGSPAEMGLLNTNVWGTQRTAVVITHRTAVLALADQIVVMQLGRILDIGRHEDLLARCELYRRLYRVQFEELDEGTGPPLAA